MGDLLKRVAKESKSEDIETQMKKIGTAFVGNRVVGAPEAVMRLHSMPLCKKSRQVVFVNSNMKSKRVARPKPYNKLKNLHDDDEDIYMTNILDRYAARPSSLDQMCLADFAVQYRLNINETENTDHILDEDIEKKNSTTQCTKEKDLLF